MMATLRTQQILVESISLIIFCFIGKSSSFSDKPCCNTLFPQRQSSEHFPLRSLQSATNGNLQSTRINNDCSHRPLYPWTVDNANDGYIFHPNQPYYVFNPSDPKHNECWQELCPPSPKLSNTCFSFFSSLFPINETPSISFVDISITWRPDEDPQRVAKRIVQECLCRSFPSDDKKMTHGKNNLTTSLEETLVESLHAYRDFCQTHMLRQRLIDFKTKTINDCDCCTSVLPQNQKLKCRLVATRGYAGAKCPQYHIDNVPCRWIQSMVGPGVELVNTSNVDDYDGRVIRWDAFSNSPGGGGDEEIIDDEDDDVVSWSVEDRNQMLVDASRADVYHSKQGEAILIPGSTWDEHSLSCLPTSTKPVVHKSPEGLRSDQCRVLFTQDIIFE